jgi:hypothetical protein
MTTYGTYSIDSVPAPNDLELKIEVIHICTFNDFIKRAGIATDRDGFHNWAMSNIDAYHEVRTAWIQDWWFYYDAFCAQQDARDLAETQADALR